MLEQIKILTRPERGKSDLRFDVGEIKIGNKKLDIYVADTFYLRRRGLRYIDKLENDKGMFFIFSEPETPIMTNFKLNFPLDVAFIDGRYFIRDIKEIPEFRMGESPVHVKGKMQTIFAIEVNQGWFKKNGIRIGDKIEIIQL